MRKTIQSIDYQTIDYIFHHNFNQTTSAFVFSERVLKQVGEKTVRIENIQLLDITVKRKFNKNH